MQPYYSQYPCAMSTNTLYMLCLPVAICHSHVIQLYHSQYPYATAIPNNPTIASMASTDTSPEYFCLVTLGPQIWRQTRVLLGSNKSPLVWRDLVDAVTHACRRFLGVWALGKALPTTWKGDGRVESRQLLATWGPLKYSIVLKSV